MSRSPQARRLMAACRRRASSRFASDIFKRGPGVGVVPEVAQLDDLALAKADDRDQPELALQAAVVSAYDPSHREQHGVAVSLGAAHLHVGLAEVLAHAPELPDRRLDPRERSGLGPAGGRMEDD